jgi:hypothetical protein
MTVFCIVLNSYTLRIFLTPENFRGKIRGLWWFDRHPLLSAFIPSKSTKALKLLDTDEHGFSRIKHGAWSEWRGFLPSSAFIRFYRRLKQRLKGFSNADNCGCTPIKPCKPGGQGAEPFCHRE